MRGTAEGGAPGHGSVRGWAMWRLRSWRVRWTTGRAVRSGLRRHSREADRGRRVRPAAERPSDRLQPAQLTEAERSALAAIHRLEEKALTASEAFRVNRKAAERVPTVAFYAAFFGGILAAALVAAVVYWTL